MKPLIIISSLFLVCCGGSDGESMGSATSLSPVVAEDKASSTPGEDNKIWVYKYDGGLQCGMGNAVSVQEMKKELDGMTIYREEKRSDGLMRTAVCGSPSGQANRYEVHENDLDRAKQKGFEVWTFD